MPIRLKETVVSTGSAFRGTRARVPDYVQRAIAESAQRGKDAARTIEPGNREKHASQPSTLK